MNDIIEKRRLTLLKRIHAARVQLDSLSLLDTTYETCRQTLRQWRADILDQLNQIHSKSLSDLKNSFDELNRFQTLFNESQISEQSLKHLQSNLHSLREREFSLDVHRASQFEENLQLLKLSNPTDQQYHLWRKSIIQCRFLISSDRQFPEILFSDQLITRIDCQTPDCVLICSLDLLNELLENENDIRVLIDQSYLPSIGIQAQRLRIDYDLILIQPAQESCPSSTERVIRIITNHSKKLIACLEDIYNICHQQSQKQIHSLSILAPSNGYNPYIPINYNRLKVHLYGGYSDVMNPMPVVNQPHFDRVLMPVGIEENLSINDIQLGILLGDSIERIQIESGAIIHIGEFLDENNKHLLTIQGTQQQVNQAFQYIRTILMINDEDSQDKNLFF